MALFTTFFSVFVTLLSPFTTVVAIDAARRDDHDVGVAPCAITARRERRGGEKKEEDAREACRRVGEFFGGFHREELSNGCATLRLSLVVFRGARGVGARRSGSLVAVAVAVAVAVGVGVGVGVAVAAVGTRLVRVRAQSDWMKAYLVGMRACPDWVDAHLAEVRAHPDWMDAHLA